MKTQDYSMKIYDHSQVAPRSQTDIGGIGIRAYMATHIMAGLMASSEHASVEAFAKTSVQCADVLIKELNNG